MNGSGNSKYSTGLTCVTLAVVLTLTSMTTLASADGRPTVCRRQASARADIDRLRAAYTAAYNKGDSAAMGQLYMPDAVRMPYDAPEQSGRRAVLAYYRGAFARRRLEPTLRLIPAAVCISGLLAIERGAYIEVFKPKSGGAILMERGKYVSVLGKDAAGHWRYTWSIFNRDAPAAPKPKTVH